MLKNKKQIVWIGFLLCFSVLGGCNYSRKHKAGKQSNAISGRVVKILDGDTYDLLPDNKTTIRIRMEGIDAPEKSMPFGKKAKEYLGDLCQEQTIHVQETGKDANGRILGFSYLEDGRELGTEMLKAGLAWHYKHYNSSPELAALEANAKQEKLGLWIEQPYILPPWTVRRLNKKGYKIRDIYKAQREHLNGQHAGVCPDTVLCKIIKDGNGYE
jgi:endonuclease YncB( thermonuclease family)